MTSLGGQDNQPLDLSCCPLDLSVKKPLISITEHINGVAHFSFALDNVANDATDKEICDIDVEAWDDSLWNAKSVIKLAEILEDWKSDEEEDTAPWRCKVSVEATEADMGLIQGEVIGDDTLDLNGISESSDFFVFCDPIDFESESQDVRDSDIEVAADDDISDKVDIGATATMAEVKLSEESTEGPPHDKYTVSEPSPRKRVFDKSLLDCWLNDNMEYTISDKRWRFEFRDELNEFEDLDAMAPCDEAMIEVSDCEEGSDIVELPIVDSAVYSDIHEEDCRSILQDSDLQIFPAEEVLEEPEQETNILETFEAAVAMVNESGAPIDSLDSLMLSDTDLDVEELLKANFKVEPNNNSDDCLSNLLIDLP